MYTLSSIDTVNLTDKDLCRKKLKGIVRKTELLTKDLAEVLVRFWLLCDKTSVEYNHAVSAFVHKTKHDGAKKKMNKKRAAKPSYNEYCNINYQKNRHKKWAKKGKILELSSYWKK